jgi:hypothetical protein
MLTRDRYVTTIIARLIKPINVAATNLHDHPRCPALTTVRRRRAKLDEEGWLGALPFPSPAKQYGQVFLLARTFRPHCGQRKSIAKPPIKAESCAWLWLVIHHLASSIERCYCDERRDQRRVIEVRPQNWIDHREQQKRRNDKWREPLACSLPAPVERHEPGK